VVGLSFDHDVGDMARAVIESVAWDVQRCLESSSSARPSTLNPVGLVLAGGGANMAPWTEILAAVTGLPVRRRRSGEAASAGAALLVQHTTGVAFGFGVDASDPIGTGISPEASMVHCYASLRPDVDAATAAVIELGR
jgi:sugar (pentulose or hexulose) kinase